MKLTSIALTLMASAITLQAHASPILLAIGSLEGSSDLSGLTGTLESGVAANVLGGIGSGLAYSGNNTFIALPDRGPNAEAYVNGELVDQTTSYIPRMHSISMELTQTNGALPFSLSASLTDTTLFFSSTP